MKHSSDIAQPLNPGAIDLWPTALPIMPWRSPIYIYRERESERERMMRIMGVLRPLLCTWQAKWAVRERERLDLYLT